MSLDQILQKLQEKLTLTLQWPLFIRFWTRFFTRFLTSFVALLLLVLVDFWCLLNLKELLAVFHSTEVPSSNLHPTPFLSVLTKTVLDAGESVHRDAFTSMHFLLRQFIRCCSSVSTQRRPLTRVAVHQDLEGKSTITKTIQIQCSWVWNTIVKY